MRGLVLTVGVLTSATALGGGDVKAAMPVLLKVLTYDVNFDSRGAGPFTVLVVADAAQLGERGALMTALGEVAVTKVKSRPVQYIAVEYKDDAALQAEIDRTKASALLVVPGMGAARVKSLWEVAQDNQLYALALEAAMVEQVLPLGVSMTGDRPQILINEKSATAVGARFETSVLKLARVIR